MASWNWVFLVSAVLSVSESVVVKNPIVSKPATQWDYLMFARMWPESFCRVANQESPGSCNIPEDVTSWTIHGLWPSDNDDPDEPSYCNKTYRFKEKEIKPIETEMNDQWPNLYKSSTAVSFWKHEWEKHGTCALTFGPLIGEMKFFTRTLNLDTTIDITEILANNGVTQSETQTYVASDVKAMLKRVLNADALLYCLKFDDDTTFLAGIRICVGKDFQPLDCPESARLKNERSNGDRIPSPDPCEDDVELIYPPITA